jgi:cytoskeletal protein CcmA (bactofilin family)
MLDFLFDIGETETVLKQITRRDRNVWKGIGKDKDKEQGKEQGRDDSIELIGMEDRTTLSQPPSQHAPFQSGLSQAKPFSNPTHFGKGISFRGEIVGKEDLEIEGRFEGKIQLPGYNVTIGKDGDVNAEVSAKTVSIHGRLIGNIVVSDKVEIFEFGSMEGDIVAPRIQIADGAKFKGSVDTQQPMEEAKTKAKSQDGVSMSRSKNP